MDYQDYITVKAERKKGQHLGAEERGAIKVLVKQGLGIRAIARAIGCAPSTVTNELQRGTPPRKSSRGKPPGYSPALGEAVYKANRSVCRKPLKAKSCKAFIVWVVEQVREHKWSLDSCYGYAREHRLYHENEMVCTCTLYNMVWAGLLPITPTELPEALKRKAKNHKAREHKRKYGQSISNRPEIAALRIEEGHWEGDTVVGKRAGNEAVVLSLLEKKTETYLALRIPAKTSEAVMEAMCTSVSFLSFSPKRLPTPFLRRIPALVRCLRHFSCRSYPFSDGHSVFKVLSIDELSQVYTFLTACAVYPKGRKSAQKTSYFHALGIVI